MKPPTKNIKPTSVKAVASLLKNGEPAQLSVGDGLYLKITGVNTGSWFFRYKINGKTRRMGLGNANIVSLSDARIKAGECRAILANNGDPLEIRNANLSDDESAITFDTVAADYIAAQREGWTNAKHAQQWTNTLATYASPVIGKLPPARITTEHILKILQPIWNTKPETARRVRNRIELVLNAAKARKLRDGENVAAWRGHLELLLTKRNKIDRKNHPALHFNRISAFWHELSTYNDTASQCLKLTILTAVRSGESMGAMWDEFDLKAGVWTIPAERMKARNEHRVPLSNEVIALLNSIPRIGSKFIFEGTEEGRPISDMTMLMKIRRMDERKFLADGVGWRDYRNTEKTITTHGFRSTFRDWAAETTRFENIVVEQALAHTIGNAVEAAYRRGDLLDRRRELMDAWASYVTMNQAPIKQ